MTDIKQQKQLAQHLNNDINIELSSLVKSLPAIFRSRFLFWSQNGIDYETSKLDNAQNSVV